MHTSIQEVPYFRNHISDLHSCDQNPTNFSLVESADQLPHQLDAPVDNSIGGQNGGCLTEENTVESMLQCLQRSSALFLIGLKEKRKITQRALQDVIDGVTRLHKSRLGALRGEVCRVLTEAGVSNPSWVPGFEALFDLEGPFGWPFIGQETQHQQLCFYKTHFQLIVSRFTDPAL